MGTEVFFFGGYLYCIFFFFQREKVPEEYFKHDPEHKFIYRFVRTLFSAAQLTAECAIVTLVRYFFFLTTCFFNFQSYAQGIVLLFT